MRSIAVILAVFLFSVLTFAQGVMPGTFTTPVQTVPFAPVLSPPIATLGNGLTPTVVTNRPMIVLPAQTGTGEVFTPSPVTAESEPAPVANAAQQPALSVTKRFDFVVDPSAVSDSASEESQSLGEIARSLRKGTPPPTGMKITNDDIQRMNQQHPASSPSTPPPPRS